MKFSAPAGRPSPHILPVVTLLLAAMMYAFPLVSQLMVAIPGSFDLTDSTETVWSVGWVYHALSTGADLWRTDRLFFPFGADLRFNVFGSLQGVMAFPFVPLLGVAGASNLVIVATLFLNGLFAYFLVGRLVPHRMSALIAAVCHMLSIAVIWHFTVGRSALPGLWIVSASLLCLMNLLEKPALWKGVLLGLSLLAAFFTDLHVAVFASLWLTFYILAYGWKNGFRGFAGIRAASLLTAVSIFGVVSFFYLLPVLPLLTGNVINAPPLDAASYYSFSIGDFLDPAYIPYIYGFDFLAAAVLAVLLFRWRGDYRFWLVSSLLFLVLSLGPFLSPTRIPLPYALVSVWTPLQHFRAAYRFVIPATIGFTVVMGYVLERLLPRISSQPALFIGGLLFILLRILYAGNIEPFKTQVYPRYEFYERIADDPDDYVILEIPFGVRSGLMQIGEGGERLQYYQPIHAKKILNGSMARLPDSLFDFYRDHPALVFFSGDTSVEPAGLPGDFSEVMRWANPKYVLVHTSLLSPGQSDAITAFLAGQPQIEGIGGEKDLIIYRVIP